MFGINDTFRVDTQHQSVNFRFCWNVKKERKKEKRKKERETFCWNVNRTEYQLQVTKWVRVHFIDAQGFENQGDGWGGLVFFKELLMFKEASAKELNLKAPPISKISYKGYPIDLKRINPFQIYGLPLNFEEHSLCSKKWTHDNLFLIFDKNFVKSYDFL